MQQNSAFPVNVWIIQWTVLELSDVCPDVHVWSLRIRCLIQSLEIWPFIYSLFRTSSADRQKTEMHIKTIDMDKKNMGRGNCYRSHRLTHEAGQIGRIFSPFTHSHLLTLSWATKFGRNTSCGGNTVLKTARLHPLWLADVLTLCEWADWSLRRHDLRFWHNAERCRPVAAADRAYFYPNMAGSCDVILFKVL